MWITTAGLQQGLHEIIHVKCLELEDASNILGSDILEEKNLPIIEFSNFRGINSPTLASFKLPVWYH